MRESTHLPPIRFIKLSHNAEMPTDIKTDFLEAAWVVEISPRAAAALLRLCVQKSLIGLGENSQQTEITIGET